MSIYVARFLPSGVFPKLRVTRFDEDLNVERVYVVTARSCTCPAGRDITCRHRRMFKRLLAIAEKGLFYNYDERMFLNIQGERVRMEEFDDDY